MRIKMNEAIQFALVGAGLGMIGGLCRVLLGAYKRYLDEKTLVLDKVSAGFNLLIGGLAGGIAAGTGLLAEPLSLLTAGYGGADFIEGVLKTTPDVRKRIAGK